MAPPRIILAAVATFSTNVLAQTQYGENHVRVSFDSDIVVQGAFPEPNATLRSPAFLPGAKFEPGWEEGTEGATDEKTLGKMNSFEMVCLDNNLVCRLLLALHSIEKPGMGDVQDYRFPVGGRTPVPISVSLYVEKYGAWNLFQIEGLAPRKCARKRASRGRSLTCALGCHGCRSKVGGQFPQEDGYYRPAAIQPRWKRM